MEGSRKAKSLKLIFGIVIPMLVIAITMIMVGASFAWFSNAEATTISSITLSVAESYSVSFNAGSALANMPYAGQEAFNEDGLLLSKQVAGENTVDISNMPYYFVNSIVLSTGNNYLDINMSFNEISIDLPNRDENGSLLDSNNQITTDYTKAYIAQNKKAYSDKSASALPVADIPYAFTWMFKLSDSQNAGTNYTETTNAAGNTVQKLVPLQPSAGEIWYTPYGTLTFEQVGDNVVVSRVNGKEEVNGRTVKVNGSIDDISDSDRKIEKFYADEACESFDFYIIFAPEKMFYQQFFAAYLTDIADSSKLSTLTANAVYGDNIGKLFENQANKMYYSAIDYSGTLFKFNAIIDVVGNTEEAGV